MEPVEINGFLSFTLAILLLFVGKNWLARHEILRRFSIPEPVIGGFLCAALMGVLYLIFDLQITFDLKTRDWLLLYFFAGIGLNSDIKTLLSGGRPLVVLTGLAAIYIVLQNLMGIGTATLFGLDPKAGLMSGSISLIGGVGTALAWAPRFVEELGISNALEIGIASNTVGLISACVIGGPIASYLIKKHGIVSSKNRDLDLGQSHDTLHEMVDKYSVLFAWLMLNQALILGYLINMGLEQLGVQLPLFVSCLLAGILFRNIGGRIFPKIKVRGSRQGLALISDICLGMFLVMALMGLKLWELKGLVLYLSVSMSLQILLTIVFTVWVVFRMMGKDYEAAVICSGFGGITLGSTATAIVNMTAVSQQHGAAHRAFIIVPLVCGFFIDVINALVIGLFVSA